MQDRVARHIRAAQVQKPAERIRQGNDGGGLAVAAEGGGEPVALCARGLAGQRDGMGKGRAHGRGGLIGPDRIHRIGDGAQGDGVAFQRGGDAGDFIGAVQPGIEAHHAFGQMFGDPGAGLHLGPGDGGEGGQVHLMLDLHAVAPVDEDARHIGQHDGKARRSGEARQPLQPFVAGGDIFALMDIRARHEETGQPLGAQVIAQAGKAPRPGGRVRGRLKALEHGLHPFFKYPSGVHGPQAQKGGGGPPYPARRSPALARFFGSSSNNPASCSVMAPASCSTSVIVTARW